MRLLLGLLAQAIALEGRAPVSRQEHLRHGTAALLDVTSQVVVRSSLLATLRQLARKEVRFEMRLAFDELRDAGPLLASPVGAAVLAIALRAKVAHAA